MSIKKEIINKTLVLTIDRPEKYNALNIATVKNLKDEIFQVQNDDSIRTIILTGSGDKSFISGADIKEMKELDSSDAKEYSLKGHKLMNTIHYEYRKLCSGRPSTHIMLTNVWTKKSFLYSYYLDFHNHLIL